MHLTHKQLVDIGARWLYNRGYEVVIKELMVYDGIECPDVLGFRRHYSFLLEAKTSRSDFKADAKKRFRQLPAKGMGLRRSFVCPTGLIKPEELPDGWGLIYVSENLRPREIVVPRAFAQYDKNREFQMLVSLTRRVVHNSEYEKYLHRPKNTEKEQKP